EQRPLLLALDALGLHDGRLRLLDMQRWMVLENLLLFGDREGAALRRLLAELTVARLVRACPGALPPDLEPGADAFAHAQPGHSGEQAQPHARGDQQREGRAGEAERGEQGLADRDAEDAARREGQRYRQAVQAH